MRRLRVWWWRLHFRRCMCGEHRLAPNTSMELAGVKHRMDGPCYYCDAYGNPR